MKRALCLLAAMLCLSAARPTPAPVPSLSEVRARGFSVTTLEGDTVALRDLLGEGRPVVIEFWATWCAPCRKTLPNLIALEKAHGDRLLVLGLTVESPSEDLSDVREYVARHGVGFPVAFAPRELFQFMNGRPDIAVPKLFVYDAAGDAVTYIPRYSPLTGRKLEAAVEEALTRSVRPAA